MQQLRCLLLCCGDLLVSLHSKEDTRPSAAAVIAAHRACHASALALFTLLWLSVEDVLFHFTFSGHTSSELRNC